MPWCCWARSIDVVVDGCARYWSSLARLLDPPTATARLKQTPDDFQVEEELGFVFSGTGEHLCVEVEKTGLGTLDAARRLAEATGLRRADVGFAGMKDRRARTRQWFSLRLPAAAEKQLQDAEDESLRIRRGARNQRKIRLGSHRANHFKLCLRDFDGGRNDLEQRLHGLAQSGVPNYFGPQRFGWRLANLAALRQRIHAGTAGADMARAERSLLYSSARAYLFNAVLSERLRRGDWNRYQPGDVLSLAGSDRLFIMGDGRWDRALEQRLASLDIHITGPLPGLKSRQAKYAIGAQAADIESKVLRQNTDILDWLKRERLRAGRRPLRFAIRDLTWAWNGGDLTLGFALPRGSYATSMIRELCSTDASEQKSQTRS